MLGLQAQDGSVIRKLKNKVVWVAADTVISVEGKKHWWAKTTLGLTIADRFGVREGVVDSDILSSVRVEPFDDEGACTHLIHFLYW